MKKLLSALMILVVISLLFVSTAQALYIRIENIGPASLAGISLNFNVENSSGEIVFFQVFSHRASNDPTNAYFPFYFDEFDMIAPGDSFDTYLIPELTDKKIGLVGYGMSTYNAFSGGSMPYLDVVPDFTSIDLISSSPAVPLTVRVSFNSGGIPIPDQTPVPVLLDIKPGSYPNSINLKSKGKVTVAILTTDDFDAYDVDPDTVNFAGADPLRWNMEDVDNDGDHDMLLHFMTQELDLIKESTEATLEGETYDGIQIVGTDSVNIVPKGK